jgi:hypothetical protein
VIPPDDYPPNDPMLADYFVIPAVSDVFFFLFLLEKEEIGLTFDPEPTLY